MKISHHIMRPDIGHNTIHQNKLKGRPTSEANRIADSVSAKIDDYSKQLHGALNQWYEDTQKIHNLIHNGPGKNLMTTLQGLQRIGKLQGKLPPDNNTVTMTPEESKAFYEWALTLTPEQQKQIPIFGYSYNYTMANGQKSNSSRGKGNPWTLYDCVTDIQAAQKNGDTIDSLSITLTPEQANSDMNKVISFSGGYPALENLFDEVSAEQTKAQNDLLRVMYLMTAIRANQKTISGALKSLTAASQSALGNVGRQ